MAEAEGRSIAYLFKLRLTKTVKTLANRDKKQRLTEVMARREELFSLVMSGYARELAADAHGCAAGQEHGVTA